MDSFAPVVIPTLNRHVHLKRCIDSLSKCTHADKTDLFIFLDYPLKDNHREGYEIIKDFLPTIDGFKTINIIEREKNFGVADNFFKSLEYVFERYDRLIFSEDDNVFAPSFLTFVNKGLEVYKEREEIFSICGYQYPVKMPKNYNNDVYIWQGFSAWGYGTWKHKWEKVEWNVIYLENFLKEKGKVSQYNSIANHYIPSLKRIVETGHITGDTIICYHLFVNNMYSVFPSVSRVRNTGHDGTGIHCEYMVADIYHNQVILDGNNNYELPFDIKPERNVNKVLYNHFKKSIKAKIKTRIKQALISFGLYPTKIL